MELVIRIVAFALGVLLILLMGDSALRTFVLPRAASPKITRLVFLAVRRVFDLITNHQKTYEQRDALMALYSPICLLLLPLVWLVMLMIGFMLMFWSLDPGSWKNAYASSGSSLLTLGFLEHTDWTRLTVSFAEASLGIGILGLLIAYLPTIYTAFSRREVLVAQMSVRAGTPPTAVDLLRRAQLINRIDNLDDIWTAWQTWFSEVEETHTSLAALVFLRSPRPDRSWVTAGGAVLDAAALHLSVVDVPRAPQAALCIRSGFLSLRAIAGFFGVPYADDPDPGDPISIDRSEFDDAVERMRQVGVPLLSDLDQAWADFRGWRVNYDQPLLGIAAITMAPFAPWSSDRSLRYRPALRRSRRWLIPGDPGVK
ncbi:MAG: hypothetical protein JWL73_1727 [Actinomycetia bacterium]|nr:hypothetical protein [Actinomycetes bacterium]